jgi:UDP-2,3-diacylglucosamine pyrophosphatase LpxH
MPDLTRAQREDILAKWRECGVIGDVHAATGITHRAIAKLLDREGIRPIARIGGPAASAQEIVAEVLRQLGRDPAGEKADVIEVAKPDPFLLNPRSMVADVSFRRFERIAYISDLHIPFQDDAAVDVACGVIRDYRPQMLLIAGDYFDFYSISDHDREPGRCDTIQDEFDSAKPTTEKIEDAAGDAVTLFLKGNHEERIDRIQRRNPGIFKLRSLELAIAADLPKSWHYYGNQVRVKCGPLTMLHGDLRNRGTSSKHAAAGMLAKLRTSCLFGHLHRFQSFFETGDDGTVRGGFANGHLCDVSQARYITSPDWQAGLSLIDFDWSLNIFKVHPQMIVRNATIFNGKTYEGLIAAA